MLSKDFLTYEELDKGDVDALIAKAADMKDKLKKGYREQPLAGKSVAIVFDKPSTRTRISFEVGVYQLGAHAVILSGQDMQLGRGETIEDTGRVISRYCDAIVIRTFEQEQLERLAAAATVPVINALTDTHHPCQALADMFTIYENKETLAGLKLAYLGDGNNVLHSLLIAAATSGMNIAAACPAAFSPDPKVVKMAKEIAAETNSTVAIVEDPMAAAKQADILYTDVWVSMGDEGERKKRVDALRPYRIDEEVMSVAKVDALVMHCLPAHRGEEIEAGILDGPNSIIFDQAENRLHAQKALLAELIGRSGRR
jgi:ornithine carbamoyltransferase